MESQLKEMLRERADHTEIEPTIPPAVVRRARARRTRNAAVAGLVTVAVAAVSIVGVRAILDLEPPMRPAAGAWRGIWPQETRAEAEKAQAAADARPERFDCTDGSVGEDNEAAFSCLQDAILWQLNAAEVARRYAVQALGWPQAYLVRRVASAGVAGPITVEVWENEFERTKVEFRATVTVERLLRKDRLGIWSVVAADQSVTPYGEETLVARFLDARVAGGPVDELLSRSAQEIYDQGEQGLSLYGGPEGAFTGYEIVTRDPAGEDTSLVLVRLSRAGGTVAESLLVGPGVDANGNPRPVLVLSVSRVEFQEIQQEPSPGARDAVIDFVTAFMEARMSGGNGADAYLSTAAHTSYVSGESLWHPDEKGLSLYAFPHPQGDPTVEYVDFRIEEVRPADASTCSWFSEAACQDAWEVVVVTELEPVDGGQAEIMQELLLVAPADGAAAEFADWMISGAARGPRPPGQ